MKYLMLFLVLNVWTISAQQDTAIEYKDQGKIKSIEYSCEQGYFKKGTDELETYRYRGISCNDGVVQTFDAGGNKITEERYRGHCNGSCYPVQDSYRTIEHYTYDYGLKYSVIWWISNESDTLKYSETFRDMDSNGIQTDSVFLNGDLLDRTVIMFFDSLQNALYWNQYLPDSSWHSHYTFWYDTAGRIIKVNYQTFESNYLPYKTSETIKFIGNTSIIHSYYYDTLRCISYSEYNDRGLVAKIKYKPVEKTEWNKPIVTKYHYIYDSQGNWIEKWVYQDRDLAAIERRKITYYPE